MRKLASIQEVLAIKPIANADAIECISILGWKLVAKKGEFQIGDRCVYFEVDSFLPIEDKFEFLRGSSYKDNEFMGKGFKLKTQKFRGQISQGLALPLSILPEGDYKLGDDVTSLLGVLKWELPEYNSSIGTIIGGFKENLHKTGETRIQYEPELLNEFRGLPYYITTKIDGTSLTIYKENGKIGLCSKENELKDDVNSIFWQTMYEKGIVDILKNSKRDNIALQGELCGIGICRNPLELRDKDWFVFNAYDMNTHEYLSFRDFMDLCEELGVKTVPIEEVGENFKYTTIEELLEKASGTYLSGRKKEGIVIRPQVETYSEILCGRLSMKVLNNSFLLKEK